MIGTLIIFFILNTSSKLEEKSNITQRKQGISKKAQKQKQANGKSIVAKERKTISKVVPPPAKNRRQSNRIKKQAKNMPKARPLPSPRKPSSNENKRKESDNGANMAENRDSLMEEYPEEEEITTEGIPREIDTASQEEAQDDDYDRDPYDEYTEKEDQIDSSPNIDKDYGALEEY